MRLVRYSSRSKHGIDFIVASLPLDNCLHDRNHANCLDLDKLLLCQRRRHFFHVAAAHPVSDLVRITHFWLLVDSQDRDIVYNINESMEHCSDILDADSLWRVLFFVLA